MPSAELITHTVNRYLELVATGTAEDVAALYADDATLEDPVGGGEIHIGRQAIAGFYRNLKGVELTTELVTLRVGGHEAAFLFKLGVTADGSSSVIEPLETMSFDGEGKITSMKAYWGPDDVTQL